MIKKHLFRILSLIIGLLLITTTLLLSSWGLKLTFAAAKTFLPTNISLEDPWSVEGNIANIKHLNLRITTAKHTLLINDANIHWDPLLFLTGKIDINTLSAHKLLIQRSSQQKEVSKKELSSLPTSFNIKRLRLDELWISPQHNIGSLSASITLNQKNELIINGQLKPVKSNIDFTGNIALHAPYPFDFQLKNQLIHKHWQLNLPMKITGTIAHYTLTGKGSLTHNAKALATVALSGDGNQTHIKPYIVIRDKDQGSFTGQFNLNWQKAFNWQANLTGHNLPLNWLLHLNNDAFLASSPNAPNTTNIDIKAGINGHYIKAIKHWQISLAKINLSTPLGPFKLKQPTNIEYPLLTSTTQHICLAQNQAKLCIKVDKRAQETSLMVYSNSIDLSRLAIKNTKMALQGILSIQGHAQKKQGAWQGNANIDIKNFMFKHSKNHSIALSRLFGIQHGKIDLSYKQGVLHSTVLLTQAPNNTLNAEILFNPENNDQGASIDALAHLNIANIGVFNDLLPAFFDPSGTISGNVRLFGPLAHPNYQGELHVRHLKTLIPKLGTNITDGHIDIINPKNNHFQLKGQLDSPKGHLNIEGAIRFVDYQPIIHLNVVGDHFLMIDLPETKVIASPNVSFSQDKHSGRFTGSVVINQANISATSFHLNDADDADISYVNQVKAKPLNLAENLKLIMGDDVHFKGFGINTYVHGKLHLSSPNESTPILATGVLSSGTKRSFYETHGKHFNIEQGQLIFEKSPLSNPRLNITAIYQMPPSRAITATLNVTLGVNVLGTLSKPQIELFSTPSMSQDDIFSYIVLGKPLQSINDKKNQSALYQAAALFAVTGGSQTIVDNLREKLGLSELMLGSLDDSNLADAPSSLATDNNDSTANNVALFLGKNLTPWLYLSYGRGLFTSKQQVQAKIYLSRHLQLRGDIAWENASSSTQNTDTGFDRGVDIFYRVDR